MKARVAWFSRWVVLGGSLLAAAGCTLLKGPKPDPTRFYVLSVSGAAVTPAAGAPVVRVRPAEIASYLRNPPLIVRRGDNEIEFREYARWGEPLEQGIARVLREELEARGVVVPSARSESAGTTQQLSVRVLACEGTAAGAVVFRATWELAGTGEGSAGTASGDFRADGLSWDGKTEAALVARLSEAVGGLAAEIAARLAKR